MTTTGLPAAEMAPADALITPPERAKDNVAQREMRIDPVLFGEDGLTIRFSAPSAPAVDPSWTVQDLPRLFDLWFAHKATGTVKQGNLEVTDDNLAETFLRNRDTIRSTRRILVDFFGTRPASDISDVDWQAFVTFMRRIPKNHGKSPAKRHQPLAQVITEADKADAARCAQAQAEEDRRARQSGSAAVKLKRSQVTALVDRLSARTVQRHQMTLVSVLDHAVEVGLIPQHGFRGYVLKDKTVAILKSATADTTRLLWGSEFEALLATEKWNSDKTRIDDHLYWTPLIARMHGLRSEEILQLEVSNIRVMDGIAFFDILQGTGQSLKSDNARRMVPIHSQLLALGFLDLVERQRSLGQKRLFAGAKRARTAKLSYSANFTKKFTYYRKSRKVYNSRMDLHALRTTFNSTLVAARVPDTARRYLMGHVNPDVGITNYLPEGFPLATLKDIIEERRFDLSMITRRFAKVDIRPRGPVLAVSNGQALPHARAGRAAS